MKYQITFKIISFPSGKRNTFIYIKSNSGSGLDQVSSFINQIDDQKTYSEYIESIDQVLSGEIEEANLGKDDIGSYIRKEMTTIVNDNFDDSPEDQIETSELRELIDVWWAKYTEFLAKEGRSVPEM